MLSGNGASWSHGQRPDGGDGLTAGTAHALDHPHPLAHGGARGAMVAASQARPSEGLLPAGFPNLPLRWKCPRDTASRRNVQRRAVARWILSSPAGLVESGLPTRAGAPLPSHSLAGVCGAQGVLHARQQTRSAAVLAAAPRVANRRSRGGAPASLSSDLSLRQLLRPACVERDKPSIT